MSEDFETKWNSILYNVERNIVELLLYKAEKVIAKIQVEIQAEVNEKKPEKIDRTYAELEGQHSRFQRNLDEIPGRSGRKLSKEI